MEARYELVQGAISSLVNSHHRKISLLEAINDFDFPIFTPRNAQPTAPLRAEVQGELSLMEHRMFQLMTEVQQLRENCKETIRLEPPIPWHLLKIRRPQYHGPYRGD